MVCLVFQKGVDPQVFNNIAYLEEAQVKAGKVEFHVMDPMYDFRISMAEAKDLAEYCRIAPLTSRRLDFLDSENVCSGRFHAMMLVDDRLHLTIKQHHGWFDIDVYGSLFSEKGSYLPKILKWNVPGWLICCVTLAACGGLFTAS